MCVRMCVCVHKYTYTHVLYTCVYANTEIYVHIHTQCLEQSQRNIIKLVLLRLL